jgi:hypothetical protein
VVCVSYCIQTHECCFQKYLGSGAHLDDSSQLVLQGVRRRTISRASASFSARPETEWLRSIHCGTFHNRSASPNIRLPPRCQLGSPQMTTLAQGSITDTSGRALRRQPVTLSLAAKTYQTTTDSAGNYAFRALPGITYPTSGTLTVMGTTQTVTVSPTEKIKVSVPSPSK